jgi:sec-independent protein translocase protein TatC
VVSIAYLKRNRRYMVVLAFVAAAFLTPDVVSMLLMAVPLMILYEIGILGAVFLMRRKPAAEKAAAGPAAGEGRDPGGPSGR